MSGRLHLKNKHRIFYHPLKLNCLTEFVFLSPKKDIFPKVIPRAPKES